MRTLLCEIPIFAGLHAGAIDFLVERLQPTTVPAGTLIVREGEPGNRLFLVERGHVRVVKHYGQPGATELAQLGPGSFFGEMCILETLPRSATVLAVEEVMLGSLVSTTFYHLFKEMPDQHSILLLNLARDLSRRLRHLDEVFAARH